MQRSREEIRRSARRRYGDITESKLERWFGKDCLDTMHYAAEGCYVPIQVAGIPAAAYRGHIVPQYEPVWMEDDRVAGMAGFASLSDLISEATTGGKLQQMAFQQVGTAATTVCPFDFWGVGTIPPAGAAGAAPPGGTVPDRTTTGALGQQNAGGADTLHLTSMTGSMTVAGSLMLFDKLLSTQTAANPGTGSIAVTGLQTRYTGASGTPEYAAGVVVSNRVTVVLPATAHNITYGYTDQDNNAGATSGANAGRASAVVGTIDLALGTWCSALAAGDTGARQLTSITFSVSPATGQVEHYLMRPLCVLPCPATNMPFVLDGINSAFNLMKVMAGACLTLRNFMATATTAVTVGGQIQFVSG